jgi:hypothetical protein
MRGAGAVIRFGCTREQGGMTPRALLRPSARPRVAGFVAAAAVIAAALPATAAARSAPPYKVDSPAIEKNRVRAGDRLALGATVRPTGRATQRRVMVAFLVSRDGRWDRGDKVIAKRRISKLGERPRRVRARPTLDAPAGGRWHVIVCAGPEKRFPRGSRTCAEAPRAVNALPARSGKRPRRPAPQPSEPAAPRFLGATDVGIDDCDTDNGTVSFEVGWWPAIDDNTDPDDIVYEVFQSREPGGEDFSHPTYTSEPGALTVTTPPLPADTYYYVVRARDGDGNVDANVAEVSGAACEDDTAADDDDE